MLNLPGYRITAKIYESQHSLVYRGERQGDSRPVVCKLLKEEFPDSEKLEAYRREYRLLNSLELEGVIRPLALEKYRNSLVLVVEDFGGRSLADWLAERGPFPPADFLELALDLSEILGAVHAANILHKDVNPSNILFNPETRTLKLIDFGQASLLPRENPSLKNPSQLEGSLAYMSPEQTGRMNRSVDYRADFYALGVTFYQLLTGELPFQADNAMELVHAHLAREAVSPSQRNAAIPPPLSALVMKLLAKMPEGRYQSAWGLAFDLRHCREQWLATGDIEPFTLAERDVPDRFRLPEQLYGRETELASLLESFNRTRYGQAEMVVISGQAGLGKTALAQAMQRPVTEKGGYFISGKFEPGHSRLPYQAILSALQELVQQLLAEQESEVAHWKARIGEALGNNAQLMIDAIPELAFMLGPQPAIQPLGPAEAQNRFQLLLLHFIQLFCRPGAPLVLFLDDMQWIDGLSLKFIHSLLEDTPYLLILGAYRVKDKLLETTQRLELAELRQLGPVTRLMEPAPLDREAVARYLADLLGQTPEQTRELARQVIAKTNGNPFFMEQFLKSMYAEKVLDFDYRQGVWRWDANKINACNITDNVVELLAGQVRQLPGNTRKVLQWAACLGPRFGVGALAEASGQDPGQVNADLWRAVSEGLLIPLESPRAGDMVYRFAHDHIQRAARALVPEAERPALHLRMGRRLLLYTASDSSELPAFTVVEQLNLGRELIDEQSERDELAALNLMTARQIKATAAYRAAAKYLGIGIQLMGMGGWRRRYDLCLALHEEALEMAYLNGEFEEMETLADTVLQHASELLDKVKVYEVRIQAYSAQNRLLAAIETAVKVLGLLGVRLPENPNAWHRLLARLEMKTALKGRRIESLADLPHMTDPFKLAVVRILSTVSYATYRARPALMPLIIYKLISLSVRHGNTPMSTYAYATHGQQLCAGSGEIVNGYHFGSLALNLLEQFHGRELVARASFIVHGFIRYWREPLADTLEPLQAAHRVGLENGDLVFSANAAFVYSVHSYFLGKDLKLCAREMAAYSEIIAQLKQKAALMSNNMYRQAVLNLSGEGNWPPYQLRGDSYDEQVMLPQHREANDRTALFQLAFNKLVLSCLFRAYREALENAAEAEQYLNATMGSLPSALFYFYAGLVSLAVYPELSAARQRETMRKLGHYQKKLRYWSQYAPMNFAHRHALVAAEQARVAGRQREAREYYDRAVALAHEHGWLNDEALAYELAGQFYLELKLGQFAQLCLHNAHYAYSRWGAQAKAQDLANRHPRIFLSTEMASGLVVTTTRTSSALDLASVLKASQAIAGELVLKRLEEKLMQVVLENAGAQKGCLLLPDGEQSWLVESCYPPSEEREELPLELEKYRNLPISIVHYVARTRESVVLADAAGSGKFTRDPYLMRRHSKSVLCTPLISQGNVSAILYLENNLATGAFTADRLEVLNLLSAQMVISLENARLYSRLEEKVAERTRELYDKNEALVRLNQEKNEFLGIAAHDLKNPLSAIRGLAEEIQEDYDQMAREEILEYAGMIHKASQKMFQLITNLLDVNAIEAGKMNITPHKVDVLPILREVARDYQGRAAAKDIRLEFEAEAESYPALADENTFQQVMDNLVSNAVKYSPMEKQIFVRVRQHQGRIRCEVQDQGPGLSHEDKEKLFGKFNRLSAKPTAGEHSTGLGLFIVKKLVEAMRAKVWCESEPGRGATFIVELAEDGGRRTEDGAM